MYLYLADAWVHPITLFNHFGLSILYKVFLRKLKDIKTLSTTFIKEQTSNYKLVGTWDNFEYWKNITGKRIGDEVKFRLVIIAL